MNASSHSLSGSPGVTLRTVAQACGVSLSTASRVLNNATNVRPAKRQAVLAAAARLGFVPNLVAKSLVAGRTRTVGLVAQFFESPFYAAILRGVEDALTGAGYSLVVSSGHWNRAEEEGCVRVLRARQVDGIIVLTGQLEDAYLAELATELPIVVTGRRLQAPGLHALPYNDFEGARAATRHLLQRGHSRIAHIAGDRSHADAGERERGYRAALQEAGIAVDPALVLQGDYIEASGARAAEDLLCRGTPFTALFAANDQMASGATQVLYRHGLLVPRDVSIVGFDGLLGTEHACPPRTTINLSAVELGRRASVALLDLLESRQPDQSAPEPELVIRSSTRYM